MFNVEIESYLEKHSYEKFAPKVVLFDMDGVLYNSMPNHVVAWQKSMEQFGLTMTPDDVYAYEGMRGFDIEKLIAKRLKNVEISDEEAQRRYEVKSNLFETLPKAQIMDGVFDLMTKIKRDGLTIGIVTGSSQRPLIERLKREFAEFVTPDHVVTAFDVERGKPYPDPYLQGLHKAGLQNPWEGIVVENAPLGVRAGVAANIFTVAVNSGPLPNSALANEGANIVFDKMTDLASEWENLVKK
jgi:HAD superfamily hydrolase (TIGR01509 family)